MSEPEDTGPENIDDIDVVAHSAEGEEEPSGCVVVHWDDQQSG